MYYSKNFQNIPLYFNFRQPVSYEEAKAFARELNERIDSLSVMTGEY
jgi:hypothetical protein